MTAGSPRPVAGTAKRPSTGPGPMVYKGLAHSSTLFQAGSNA